MDSNANDRFETNELSQNQDNTEKSVFTLWLCKYECQDVYAISMLY